MIECFFTMKNIKRGVVKAEPFFYSNIILDLKPIDFVI